MTCSRDHHKAKGQHGVGCHVVAEDHVGLGGLGDGPADHDERVPVLDDAVAEQGEQHLGAGGPAPGEGVPHLGGVDGGVGQGDAPRHVELAEQTHASGLDKR